MIMNSIDHIHQRTSLILYADDLTILHYVPPGELDHSQDELNHISAWCQLNKLFINPSKCKVINFTLSKQSSQPQHRDLFLSNSSLSEVSCIKLLGVYFTNNMSPKPHGEYVLNKCAKGMAMLRKLKRSGTPNVVLWKLYLPLVFSHIQYAWPALCDMPSSVTSKFALIERQACRLANLPFLQHHLTNRLNKQCIKLIRAIAANANHPLRDLFKCRSPSIYPLRRFPALLPVNNSARILKTFAKFYVHS